MRPTEEEMLNGACNWNYFIKGMSYSLSFHGYKKPNFNSEFFFEREGSEGTWCYYLHIPELMYPKAFDSFTDGVNQSGYYTPSVLFDSCEFYGGVTYFGVTKHWSPKLKREYRSIKVGCDYNHLWDRESGYPNDFISVRRDAERTLALFLELAPPERLRCEYTGKYGPVRMFYEANNGCLVYKTAMKKVTHELSEGWLPKGETK